jgi:hypothetical protein
MVLEWVKYETIIIIVWLKTLVCEYCRLFSLFFKLEICEFCSETLYSLNINSVVFDFYEFVADLDYIKSVCGIQF